LEIYDNTSVEIKDAYIMFIFYKLCYEILRKLSVDIIRPVYFHFDDKQLQFK